MEPIQEMEHILMEGRSKYLEPDRRQFAADPIGYSALAWHRWGLVQEMAGFPVSFNVPPTNEDLNSPVLWLTHAHAIAEAARVVFLNEPNFSLISRNMSGMCDSQYCAVGLMLVAYSLEVSLKAMLIMQKGIADYLIDEKKHRHHRLVELADFIPDLSDKDRAILEALTHFSMWAGRYPDPGFGKKQSAQKIFEIGEQHQITAKELFQLASQVMGYARKQADEV